MGKMINELKKLILLCVNISGIEFPTTPPVQYFLHLILCVLFSFIRHYGYLIKTVEMESQLQKRSQ